MNFEPVARPESNFAKKFRKETPVRNMYVAGSTNKLMKNDDPEFDVSAFSPSGYKIASDRINRLVQMSDNPEQEIEDLQLASYLGSRTTYSPEYIYSNREAVLNEVAGYDMSTDVRKNINYFFSTIKYTTQANQAYLKFETRGDEIDKAKVSDEERTQMFDELRADIIKFNSSQPDFEKVKGWIPEVYLDQIAQTMPYMARAFVGNVAGRVLGLGLSALVPPAAPVILTAQFISSWAGRLGGMFAVKPLLNASSYVDRLTMQDEDGEYLDPALANFGSEVSSWLEAAVESMAFDVFAPWIGGLFGRTGGSALVNSSISKVLKNTAKTYFKGVAAESAEEGLQAIVRDVTDNVLKTIDANADGRKWDKVSFGRVLGNAADEFLRSIPTMATLGLISGGIGTGINLGKIKKTLKYNADVHFSGEGNVVPIGTVLTTPTKYDKEATDTQINTARSGKEKIAPIDVYKVGDLLGRAIYRAVGGQETLQALKEKGVQNVRINEVSKADFIAPAGEENYQKLYDMVNQAALDAGMLLDTVDGRGVIIASNKEALKQLELDDSIPFTQLTKANDFITVANDFGVHLLDLGVDIGGEGNIEAVTESTHAVRDLMFGRAVEGLVKEMEASGETETSGKLRSILKSIYENAHTVDDVFKAQEFAQQKKLEILDLIKNDENHQYDSYAEALKKISLKAKPNVKKFRADSQAKKLDDTPEKAPGVMDIDEFADDLAKKEADTTAQGEGVKKNKQDQVKDEWKKDPKQVDEKKLEAVKKRAAELDKKAGTTTIVVEDGRFLPEKVRKDAEKGGLSPNQVKGVSFGEKVYINASSVTNVDETWAHEWIAHRGLRVLLGTNFKSEMTKLYDSIGESTIKAGINKVYHTLSKDIQAEEYFAAMAEKFQQDGTINQNAWEKIKTFLQSVLKKLGITTVTDIKALLAQANTALNRYTISTVDGAKIIISSSKLNEVQRKYKDATKKSSAVSRRANKAEKNMNRLNRLVESGDLEAKAERAKLIKTSDANKALIRRINALLNINTVHTDKQGNTVEARERTAAEEEELQQLYDERANSTDMFILRDEAGRLSSIADDIAEGMTQEELDEADREAFREMDAEEDGARFQAGAWHGSPFGFDRFDINKIGTGEGAQAFGWGLYFSSIEDVARQYARNLGGMQLLTKGGDKFEDILSPQAKKKLSSFRYDLVIAGDSLEKAIENLKLGREQAQVWIDQGYNIESNTRAVDGANEVLAKIKQLVIKQNRNLYKVTLHEGKDPSEYTWLEWKDDFPRAKYEQPVRAELEKLGLDPNLHGVWDSKYGKSGSSIYFKITGMFMNGKRSQDEAQKEASLLLLRAGIDGIRYPAQSQGRGDYSKGTNYVVFDESAVTIDEHIRFQVLPETYNPKTPITIDGITFDNVDGKGGTPNQQDANYFGFTATMSASKFLLLATSMVEFQEETVKPTVEGTIASPFLSAEWDDVHNIWRVRSHEGRHRVSSIIKEKGENFEIPVNIMTIGKRGHNLTKEQATANFVPEWSSSMIVRVAGTRYLQGEKVQAGEDYNKGSNILKDIESYPELDALDKRILEIAKKQAVERVRSTDPYLDPILDFLVESDRAIRFQVAPAVDTKEFKDFFKESKVSNEDGEAILMHHATTHQFNTFTNDRANPENDMGKGFYFTSSEDDADINYRGEGPDLTSRIERLSETILDSMQEDPEKFGFDESYDPTDEDATAYARRELSGGEEIVLDVYINMENPVIIGTPFGIGETQETFIDSGYKLNWEDYKDEANESLLEDWEADEIDEDMIQERAEEIAQENGDEEVDGGVNGLIEEIQSLQEFDEINIDEITQSLEEFLLEGGRASEIIEALKKSEGLSSATDENGNLASGEIIRQAFENLGYDGILDFTVNEKFGSARKLGQKMQGVYEDTFHAIAFKSEQVKSTENQGTFDPTNPDIRFQLSPPVDTPAFKKFFGNSKVVDADGKPRPMFHGTPYRDFNAFDKSFSGQSTRQANTSTGVTFFTASKETAGIFTTKGANGISQGDGRIIEAYLSVQNPYVMSSSEWAKILLPEDEFWEALEEAESNLESYMSESIQVDPINREVVNYEAIESTPEAEQAWENYSDVVANGIDTFAKSDEWWANFYNDKRDKGHDGIIVESDGGTNTIPETKDDMVIVFSPTQIKSVNNTGSFDPLNPDIRFSVSTDPLQTLHQEGYVIPDEILDKYKDSEWAEKSRKRSELASKYPELVVESKGFSQVADFIEFTRAMTPYELSDEDLTTLYETKQVQNPGEAKQEFRDTVMDDDGLRGILGDINIGNRTGDLPRDGNISSKASKILSDDELERTRNSILKNIDNYYFDWLISLGTEEAITQLEYERLLLEIGVDVAENVDGLLMGSEVAEETKKSIAPMIKDKELRDQFLAGTLSIVDIDKRLSKNKKTITELRNNLKTILYDSTQYQRVYRNIQNKLKEYDTERNKRSAVQKRVIKLHKQAVKKAVERGLPVPDKNLELYRNEDWAQDEIGKRELFRNYSWIVDLAKKAETPEELMSLVKSRLDADDDTPNLSNDFIEEAFRRGNAANSEQFYVNEFTKKIESLEGMRGVLNTIRENVENFYGIGLPQRVWNILNKGEEATDKDLDNLRAYIFRYSRKIARVYYTGIGNQDAVDQFRSEEVFEEDKVTVEDRVKIAAMAEDQELKNKILKGDYTYSEMKEFVDKYNKDIADSMRGEETLDRKLIKTENEMEKKVSQLREDKKLIRADRDNKIAQTQKLYQDRIAKLRAEKNKKIAKQKDELQTKYKNRDAARKTRQHMKGRYSRMSRKVPVGSVDISYGKKLETFTELFNGRIKQVVDKSRSTELIDVMKNFLNYTSDDFVNKLTEFADMALDEFTHDQLEELYTISQDLRSAGREIKKAKDLAIQIRRKGVIAELRSEILSGDEQVEFTDLGTVETDKEQQSSVTFKTWAATHRPSRMIDRLGGKTMKQWFIENVNRDTDKEILQYDRRHKAGVAKMKELGIEGKSLNKHLSWNGKSLSVDKVIHLYLAMMNDASRAAVLFGNKIPIERVNGLVAQLSQKEKDWGLWMMQEFEDNYKRLNEAFINDKNVDMGKEENYFPMMRRDLEGNAMGAGQLMGEQYAIRNAWKKAYVAKKFAIARVKLADEHQIPIQLGSTSVWLSQIDAQEHYINTQELVKDLQYFQNDQSIKDALKQKYGTKAARWLLKYVNDFASPNIYRSQGEEASLSRILRGNMAIAYLGFNMLTMLKQAPSLGFYLREAGPQNIMKAAFQMITDPVGTIKFVEERDPQMLVRAYNRITEELKTMSEKNVALRTIKKVGTLGMKPIMWMDKAITTIGWLATYNSKLYGKAKMTEIQAAREAQRVTLETQPSGRAKDLAEIYRGEEFKNWLLMFSNQLNQIWNMYTYDIPAAIKEHEFRKLIGILAGVGISGVSIAFLSGWRPPDDPEDLPKSVSLELAKNFIASIPMVGSNARAGWDKEYFMSGLEIVPAATSIFSFAKDVATWDTEKMPKDLAQMFKDAGVTAGVPVTAINRSVNAVKHKDLIELLGYGFTQHRR